MRRNTKNFRKTKRMYEISKKHGWLRDEWYTERQVNGLTFIAVKSANSTTLNKKGREVHCYDIFYPNPVLDISDRSNWYHFASSAGVGELNEAMKRGMRKVDDNEKKFLARQDLEHILSALESEAKPSQSGM